MALQYRNIGAAAIGETASAKSAASYHRKTSIKRDMLSYNALITRAIGAGNVTSAL